MENEPIQLLFLIATFLSVSGIIIIIYARDIVGIANRLFILILILVLGYLVSHSVHFLFMYNKDVTILDISCHSFLLLIIVTLTFFTWNYPKPQQMGLVKTIIILFPSLLLLILLWTGALISASHAHHGMFEAHYNKMYPFYLFWYLCLILTNIYWVYNKRSSETNQQIRSQLLLFLLGMIITNFTTFMVGLFLPWIVGFYFLVEMSPFAFLVGVILFTAIAIGKYNMFPAALNKVNSFTIKRKMFFSSLIIVPIIILVIQIPLGRLIFNIGTSTELTRYFFISLFVGIIVSISITFIILQVISNPLNRLKERVVDIEKGNYGIQIEYSSNDEIGELSTAFNHMSKTLKENSADLQIKENRISLLLSAFENATAAIAILNSNYLVIESNNRFCNLVKKNKNDVLGERILELQFSDNAKYYNDLITSLSKNERFSGELETIDSDGERKHLLISATYVTINNEAFSGYLFVELDITDRKKLEQQLAQSEKLAALGQMSAILAHEIKTPLTSIKLNTDMLSESLKLSNEDQSSFNIISKEINRMNNLVKEVLQFSRQIDLDYSNENISDIIESILLETHNRTVLKKISVVNKVESQQLEIDPGKIKQVLLNMIDNSIESMETGGVIEISTKKNLETNELSIFIKDNGNGVSGGEKIFEPFFTTKTSGTGLGLSISQKIIEQHKGALKLISSKLGETIFEIVLPLNKN